MTSLFGISGTIVGESKLTSLFGVIGTMVRDVKLTLFGIGGTM